MRINRVLSNERPMCCCFFLYRRRSRRQQPINLENTLQESIANDEKERELTKKNHTNYIVREPK